MSFVADLLGIFQKAAGVDPKRPIFQESERGNLLYSDCSQSYALLMPELKRGVSTVESLADVVLEESRRRGNPTGNFMTVMFNEKGGVFYPDDAKRLDLWTYERRLSQQWEFLIKNLGRDMKHLDFIRFLQGLRPSMVDYLAISREFKKVTFDGKTSVTSQPIVENGQAGEQIAFTLDTKNGETSTAMPAGFKLNLQYARGSSIFYTLEIELDVYLDESKQPRFRPVCPDLEAVIEEAITDELNLFKERVSEKDELLTLLDY